MFILFSIFQATLHTFFNIIDILKPGEECYVFEERFLPFRSLPSTALYYTKRARTRNIILVYPRVPGRWMAEKRESEEFSWGRVGKGRDGRKKNKGGELACERKGVRK